MNAAHVAPPMIRGRYVNRAGGIPPRPKTRTPPGRYAARLSNAAPVYGGKRPARIPARAALWGRGYRHIFKSQSTGYRAGGPSIHARGRGMWGLKGRGSGVPPFRAVLICAAPHARGGGPVLLTSQRYHLSLCNAIGIYAFDGVDRKV